MKSPTCKSKCLLFLCIITTTLGAALSAHASQTEHPDAKAQAAESDKQSLAFRNGFQDGWIAGEEAWANSGPFRLNSNEQYSKASHGYADNLGDKNEYKRLYRKGFEEGYSVGYGQSPPTRIRKD